MKLTKNELQQHIDILPIGYYAHARVEVKVDDEFHTSYFSPATREIFISLKGVNNSLKNVDGTDPDKAERAVRAHLYHELSHAILTPRQLNVDDEINVFEDERIETLLKDYYHKVDFKTNIKELCDFDGTPPTNNFQKFFYAVRFRIGKKEWLDEVDRIIKEYAHLNWNSEVRKCWNYQGEIRDLYTRICNEKMSKQEWQDLIDEKAKEQAEQGKGENADIPEDYDTSSANSEEEESAEGKEKAKSQNVKEGEGEGGEEETDQFGHEAGEGNPLAEALENAFASLRDPELYDALDNVLQNYSKKNKGGNALQAHSGVLNPRLCGREDCRFFERRATANGSNTYGSLHLNLFIDESGSFSHNAELANKVIATLADLERRYSSFFSVDFAFCGDYVHKVDKSHSYLNPSTGTHIPYEALEVVKGMQKKGEFNYNIVLYDGNAYWERGSLKHCYEPFDYSNFTLILDTSCAQNAKRIKNAKVIISNDYLGELKKNILLTLQRAFR